MKKKIIKFLVKSKNFKISQQNYPNLTVNDMISPKIIIVQKKILTKNIQIT